MNIASLQAMAGKSLQSSTNRMQAGQPLAGTFGSVFSGIAGKAQLAVVPAQESIASGIPDESLMAIFNATSIEELETAIKGLTGDESEESISKLDSLTNLGNLEELASLLDLEPKQLLESLLQLLETAGLDEGELSVIANTNDFWTVLNALDKVAPQFFKQLTDALEGKGEIPKQQAIELLTLLKTAELTAPKTDLLMKQEQQVFTLQGYLATAGEHFEKVLHSNSSAKNVIAGLMESKNISRFAVHADAGRTMTDDGTAEKGSESSATMGTKDASQQVASSAFGTVVAAKGELTLTELENRNNARNDTLIKEMQNVFKRSNFGQADGTNRLLIKLYPEHLGQVRIELLQVNGIMTARILASTAQGKEMLDSQLHQLRSAFLQQNLQVERIDVSQTLQDTSKNDREQAFNQHFRNEGQEKEEQHELNDDEEMTFQEYMIELEA
ncbi:flagellar hook-length control protein FliK [Sporosarcina sp. ANT_H38]|uniref:flagellar hook-length control protein FliK n=1 Tax=Sporosarcina sp. ANT_H38 TaxID=2597358 RepID=UPI0011F0E80D|nr:flagellar hook-length control protein FliK [Sporosarcina sp. ANT_H38]KAA0966511.1 flagellar hook-length control protein FliK [Sporosarcina sp. ANT_H38]